MPTVDVKVLDARLKDAAGDYAPHYATPGSAGIDLRACIDVAMKIHPGETILVPTGMAIHLADPGLAAMILPRSGLGHKHGIVLGNLVGLIDSDYQGVIVCFNRGIVAMKHSPSIRSTGWRNVVVVPVVQVTFNVVNEFASSERGSGGFGSTGKA